MNILNLFIYSNILLTLVFFNLNPLNAAPLPHSYKTESCLYAKHPTLKAVISKLKQFPETNRLIEEALKEGSITVDITYQGMPFEAMWDSAMRKIVIDGRSYDDQGKLLCHLLFELTNAVSESQYQELYRTAINGRINCDSYVEAVEKIEHENMIYTAHVIEKGIAAGIFSSSTKWKIIDDFAVHYQIQQLTGHSLFIAEEYQGIARQYGFSPYQGTVKNLKKMSQKEKRLLAELLYSDYFNPKGKSKSFS